MEGIKLSISLAVGVFLVLCAQNVALAVTTHGDVSRVWMRVGGYETPDEDCELTEEQSYTWQWMDPNIVGTAYGYADISTPETGTIKACPILYYHDPFGPGELSMASDVGSWKELVVTSDVLPAGTPVRVSLAVDYAGSWQVIEPTPGRSANGYGSFQVFVSDEDDNIVASMGGSARITAYGDAMDDLDVTGDWVGQIGGGAGFYVIDYSDTLVFDLNVDQVYWLYFDLATSANSSAGDGSGWDASETLAAVDFSNTATYQLESVDLVAFEIVPEPTSLLLFLAMAIPAWRRRR